MATNNNFAAFAGPNGWNDPDMLEVGNFVFPTDETDAVIADYRAHFTLWSIMAAPLITGNDLRVMTPAVTAVLTNTEVIALDQDLLGYQGAVFNERRRHHLAVGSGPSRSTRAARAAWCSTTAPTPPPT